MRSPRATRGTRKAGAPRRIDRNAPRRADVRLEIAEASRLSAAPPPRIGYRETVPARETRARTVLALDRIVYISGGW